MEPMISHQLLQTLLDYNPETGIFSWAVSRPGCRAGDRAGSRGAWGYRVIGGNEQYREHRLVWFYMTGAWPDRDVDHVNRNRSDNRWENLRLCSASQNAANVGQKARNTSGLKGVSWDKDRGLWLAQIRIAGKKKNLGRFTDQSEAKAVYDAAAKQQWGEFVCDHA